MERRSIGPRSNRVEEKEKHIEERWRKRSKNGMKREERKRNHETKKMKREKR